MQGDPMAMHLFTLYIHPLLCKLENICNSQNDLVNCYADDISIITTDLNKIFNIKKHSRNTKLSQEQSLTQTNPWQWT